MEGDMLMDDKSKHFGKVFENTNWLLITARSSVSLFESRRDCSLLPKGREN
jgi:hypothetical protein